MEAALATQRAHGLLYAHALRRIASATDRRSGEARGGRGGGGAAAEEEEEEHADIAAAIDTADASPSPLLSEWAAAERLSAVGEAEAPPPPPRATAAAAAAAADEEDMSRTLMTCPRHVHRPPPPPRRRRRAGRRRARLRRLSCLQACSTASARARGRVSP